MYKIKNKKHEMLNYMFNKNILIINYNFDTYCKDDRDFLLTGLQENLKKVFGFKFNIEYNYSKEIYVEVNKNNNINDILLRKFRMDANKYLRLYMEKLYR